MITSNKLFLSHSVTRDKKERTRYTTKGEAATIRVIARIPGRFSLEAQGVNDHQDLAIVMALQSNLKDCSFMRSLARSLVKTLVEATKRAQKYIREEDLVNS